MTKPSYEELETRIRELDAECKRLSCVDEAQDELEAENLRVRGLLQRGYELLKRTTLMTDPRDEFEWRDDRSEWLTEAQGAESADIGKLDAADKSGVEMGKVNPPPGVQDYENLLKAGSAETGGEKAASLDELKEWVENLRESCHANYNGGHHEEETHAAFHHGMDTVCNVLAGHDGKPGAIHRLASFPRRSQNQAVSTGVEGAHKGTSADKCSRVASKEECAAHSREPEKLNNAQKVAGARPSPLSRVNFFGTRGHEGGIEAYLERTSDTTFALRTGRGYLLMSDIPASVADALTWPTEPVALSESSHA